MVKGYYKCECGKEFTNPQSFNAHKAKCAIHHKVVGNYDEWIEHEKILVRKRADALKNNNAIRKGKLLETWISEQHQCEKCGKVMTEHYGSGRFCSKRCACSKQHSEETKQKIGMSVKGNIPQNKINCQKNYSNNPNICVICGNILPYEYRYRKTCCKECHCKLLQQIQADLLSSGKHTAWKTRDNLSYAEKFWMDILVVNNIKFEHNMPYRCDNTCYFLDFYLYPNIDLEIDGKQHNYADRKAHDELRDSRLTKCGITVYRIPVVSLKNPDKVKKQVDEFLEWYMNIRNDLSNDTNS